MWTAALTARPFGGNLAAVVRYELAATDDRGHRDWI